MNRTMPALCFAMLSMLATQHPIFEVAPAHHPGSLHRKHSSEDNPFLQGPSGFHLASFVWSAAYLLNFKSNCLCPMWFSPTWAIKLPRNDSPSLLEVRRQRNKQNLDQDCQLHLSSHFWAAKSVLASNS